MPTVKENLTVIRDFMKTLPPERVALDTYQTGGCDSIGCICGWAATLPHFNRQGLTLGPIQGGTHWPYIDGLEAAYSSFYLRPIFGDLVGKGLLAPAGGGPEQGDDFPADFELIDEDGDYIVTVNGKEITDHELAIARLDYAISKEPA